MKWNILYRELIFIFSLDDRLLRMNWKFNLMKNMEESGFGWESRVDRWWPTDRWKLCRVPAAAHWSASPSCLLPRSFYPNFFFLSSSSLASPCPSGSLFFYSILPTTPVRTHTAGPLPPLPLILLLFHLSSLYRQDPTLAGDTARWMAGCNGSAPWESEGKGAFDG